MYIYEIIFKFIIYIYKMSIVVKNITIMRNNVLFINQPMWEIIFWKKDNVTIAVIGIEN